jgi:hypothetical protein
MLHHVKPPILDPGDTTRHDVTPTRNVQFDIYSDVVQATEDISKTLTQIKLLLYGDGGARNPSARQHSSYQSDHSIFFFAWTCDERYISRAENEPQPELVAQLAQEMYSNDMLQSMVSNMWRFEFEVCRGVSPAPAVYTPSITESSILEEGNLTLTD